jgi:hypothetical protein
MVGQEYGDDVVLFQESPSGNPLHQFQEDERGEKSLRETKEKIGEFKGKTSGKR